METTLGILAQESGVRDAVHVATMSVVAAQNLRPGDHVGILTDGQVGLSINPIGIVDPFLSDTIKKGEVFQLCLYPKSTVRLRHVWQHPVIDALKEPAYKKIEKAFAEQIKRYENVANDDIPPYKAPSTADELESAWNHMKSFASQCEISVQEVMDYADAKYRGEHVLHICRGFTEPDITYEMEDFWKHYCVIRNVTMPEGFDTSEGFVSCSC
jgi:hypothetical protein